MDKLQQAIGALHEIDREAERRSRSAAIHPAARLLVTLAYMVTAVSFSKYDLLGLLGLLLYLAAEAIYEDLPLRKGLWRLRYLLLPLLFIGIANPFLDRAVLLHWGPLLITSGMVSLATLFLKGLFTVCATYFLIVSVGIGGICCALRTFHMPQQFVTVLLLIYRYLSVFLKEIQRMTQAYRLRAPGQRGVHFRAWGPFVGLLLLRSIDRATDVYNSMLLRGYDGSFTYERAALRGQSSFGKSLAYSILWCAAFLCLRLFPVFSLVGGLFFH